METENVNKEFNDLTENSITDEEYAGILVVPDINTKDYIIVEVEFLLSETP